MILFIGVGRSNLGDTFHCINCHQQLAIKEDICRIFDRPSIKSYTNPAGVLCSIMTFADAIGLLADDYSSSEHTWFAGYAWRPVACGQCGLFLGWQFESETVQEQDVFFGLLTERLVAPENTDGLPS